MYIASRPDSPLLTKTPPYDTWWNKRRLMKALCLLPGPYFAVVRPIRVGLVFFRCRSSASKVRSQIHYSVSHPTEILMTLLICEHCGAITHHAGSGNLLRS